ncbi:MAG: GDP-mannose mannosyl hydrolase [Verrucomicrobiota bacterium]
MFAVSNPLSGEEFLGMVEFMPLVSIDFIIRNQQGEILLGKRNNAPAKNYWFVPGGRIWKNECIQDAARRIARKEIGFELSRPKLFGVFDHIYPDNFMEKPGINTHYVVIALDSTLSSAAKIQPDEQHSDLRFWSIADLLSDPNVHPNTRRYFDGAPSIPLVKKSLEHS